MMIVNDNDDEEETVVNFLDIPPEIRVKIYKSLNSKNLAKMRLLSRQIKREIEEHGNFHIVLDQGYRGFRRLYRLGVKSCKVTNLTHHHLPARQLFTFPRKLKILKLDGNVSRANLLKIFNHCTEIVQFSVTHETMGIHELFHDQRIIKSLQRNLQKVSHLDVQLLRYPVADPFVTNPNIDVILNLSFPVLKSFKLCFSLWGNYVKIFYFIKKHVATLQELELQVGDSVDAKNTEMYLRSDRSQDRNVRELVDINILASLKLVKFILRDDVLNTNPTVAVYFLEVLEQLTTLKQFHFHSPGEMTIQNVRNIVANNEGRLERFIVSNVKNPVAPVNQNHDNNPVPGIVPCFPFDMSIFQRCMHLTTLELSCNSPHQENNLEATSIKLINLHKISNSIQRLCLSGFLLDLQEVVDWSQNANSLEELIIADAGPMKYSTLLACVLRNCAQLSYLNVRPIMTRVSNDAAWWKELEELSKLYNHFMGIPFDPIDDLDGFETKITGADRTWVMENVQCVQMAFL